MMVHWWCQSSSYMVMNMHIDLSVYLNNNFYILSLFIGSILLFGDKINFNEKQTVFFSVFVFIISIISVDFNAIALSDGLSVLILFVFSIISIVNLKSKNIQKKHE